MRQQRGIFEKIINSNEWWIRYADMSGQIRREKVDKFDEAAARLSVRKHEAKLGILSRLAWRRRPVLFRRIAEANN
jgi:hypothetical protein